MKRFCVIGHFGYGDNLVNGQTIKTKIISKELCRQLGKENIITIDTCWKVRTIPLLILEIIRAIIICKNIVMLPAQNGIKVFAPLLLGGKLICGVHIHYIVIGAWLPQLAKKKKFLSYILKQFNGIYVETETMKKQLETQ